MTKHIPKRNEALLFNHVRNHPQALTASNRIGSPEHPAMLRALIPLFCYAIDGEGLKTFVMILLNIAAWLELFHEARVTGNSKIE